VDRGVEHIYDALREEGEVKNTAILYTSDNGYLLGQHREVAKVRALGAGRDYVLPEDVQAVAAPVLAHRLILAPEARSAGVAAAELVREAVEGTPVPV